MKRYTITNDGLAFNPDTPETKNYVVATHLLDEAHTFETLGRAHPEKMSHVLEAIKAGHFHVGFRYRNAGGSKVDYMEIQWD